MEPVSSFTHFMTTLKLGMKQGLQGQTRAQRQVNFKDNSNIVRKPINAQNHMELNCEMQNGFQEMPRQSIYCDKWREMAERYKDKKTQFQHDLLTLSTVKMGIRIWMRMGIRIG
jgi:hypothetical protein